jgi:hypothetical protein
MKQESDLLFIEMVLTVSLYCPREEGKHSREKNYFFNGASICCAKCHKWIRWDDPTDEGVVRAPGLIPGYEDPHRAHVLTLKHVRWARYKMHIRCILEPSLDTFKQELDVLHKKNFSAQILLLLQATGLPWDLAWPIAAITCWLL